MAKKDSSTKKGNSKGKVEKKPDIKEKDGGCYSPISEKGGVGHDPSSDRTTEPPKTGRVDKS